MDESTILGLCWIIGGVSTATLYYRRLGKPLICRHLEKGDRKKAKEELVFVVGLVIMWWLLLFLGAIVIAGYPLLWLADRQEERAKNKPDKRSPLDWLVDRIICS